MEVNCEESEARKANRTKEQRNWTHLVKSMTALWYDMGFLTWETETEAEGF